MGFINITSLKSSHRMFPSRKINCNFVKTLVVLTTSLLVLVGCGATGRSNIQVSSEVEKIFDRFVPQPSQNSSIDYSLINEFLNAYVVVSGPSIRQRRSLPKRPTGTFIYYGHTSPYRLEGNKIAYSDFGPSTRAAIPEYVDSLIDIANNKNLTSLPKSEQLAFWFNLHNMLVIREITKTYPKRYPSKLQPFEDGVVLHDAKLVTINDVPLSLTDIRTKIVFQNWKDPMVFYGFYHGDIASPSIRNRAYSGETVFADLNSNANEYVNSLRGINNSFGPTEISPLYSEAQPYLFPDWPKDFVAHVLTQTNENVRTIVENTDTFNFARREMHVTDLMGGMIAPVYRIHWTDTPEFVAYNRLKFMEEFAVKQNILVRQLREVGTVTVQDLPSDENEEDDNQ